MKLDTFGRTIHYHLGYPLIPSLSLNRTPNQPIPASPKPKHDWAFKLYHSNRCTGNAVEFTGIGSSACPSDTPNGGAKGATFEVILIRLVLLICTGMIIVGVIGPRLDDIRSNIEDKWKKTPGTKRKRVKNFDVICS